MEEFIMRVYIPIVLGIVVTAGAVYVVAAVIKELQSKY